MLGQKLDPKDRQVINLDQDVLLCGYFFGGWRMNTFSWTTLSFILFLGYGLSFFSLFFLNTWTFMSPIFFIFLLMLS
jgi:hypothetical protein